MLRSWRPAGLILGCGVLLSAVPFTDSSPVVGIIVLVLFCALAVRLSPLLFPRPTSAAEAQARSANDGRPIVYWRPGCRYCLRLAPGSVARPGWRTGSTSGATPRAPPPYGP